MVQRIGDYIALHKKNGTLTVGLHNDNTLHICRPWQSYYEREDTSWGGFLRLLHAPSGTAVFGQKGNTPQVYDANTLDSVGHRYAFLRETGVDGANEHVLIGATAPGPDGNEITLAGDGATSWSTLVANWNAANPGNTCYLAWGEFNGEGIPDAGTTWELRHGSWDAIGLYMALTPSDAAFTRDGAWLIMIHTVVHVMDTAADWRTDLLAYESLEEPFKRIGVQTGNAPEFRHVSSSNDFLAVSFKTGRREMWDYRVQIREIGGVWGIVHNIILPSTMIRQIHFSRDGNYLYVSRDGVLHVYDTNSWEVIESFADAIDAEGWKIVTDSTDSTLLAYVSTSEAVVVRETETWNIVALLPGESPSNLNFDSEGLYFGYCGDPGYEQHSARVYRIRDWSLDWHASGSQFVHRFNTISFSPTEKKLVCGTGNFIESRPRPIIDAGVLQ